MFEPQHFYWALLAVLVLPSSFFSRVAAVVIVVFLTNFAIWNAGVPEAYAMTITYAVALLLALWLARRLSDFLVAVMFLPLAVASYSQAIGGIPDYSGWWIIFWMAVMQALSTPPAVDWREVWASIRRGEIPHFFPPYERVINVPAIASELAASSWNWCSSLIGGDETQRETQRIDTY